MTLATLVDTFTNTIVTALSSLIISVTILIFFYGIIEYILGRKEGDANKIKAGNTFMTWGLVALFVMFSVYGIVRLSQSILFNNKDVKTIDIPSFDARKVR